MEFTIITRHILIFSIRHELHGSWVSKTKLFKSYSQWRLTFQVKQSGVKKCINDGKVGDINEYTRRQKFFHFEIRLCSLGHLVMKEKLVSCRKLQCSRILQIKLLRAAA